MSLDVSILTNLSKFERKYLSGKALSETVIKSLKPKELENNFYVLLPYIGNTYIKHLTNIVSVNDDYLIISLIDHLDNFKDVLLLRFKYMYLSWFIFNENIDNLILNSWKWATSEGDMATLSRQTLRIDI